MAQRTFSDTDDPSSSFGNTGWQPAPGESPAEREKRMKREKRLAKLAAAGLAPPSSSSFPSHDQAPQAPAPAFATARRADEDYGGWKPAEGESPAEREKRLKREKRAQKMAGAGGHGAPPAPTAAPAVALETTKRAAGEEYGGWRPMDDGESPAEREKRIKREKRAAMLAAKEGQGGGAASTPISGGQEHGYYPPPPHLAQQPSSSSYHSEPSASFSLAATLVHPDRAFDVASADASAAAEAEKKSKHSQSKTPARLKYLERKKKVRKAKKKAAPPARAGGKAGEGEKSREASVAASSVTGEGGAALPEAARKLVEALQQGKKRKRSGEEDDSDSSDDEKDSSAVPKANLTPEELAAKQALIAQKKAERREKRLAKKADLKRIKAEGGVVPPPKKRVVETTKPRVRVVEEENEGKGEEEGKEQEKSEEEVERERKEEEEREAIRQRKEAKAAKKAQRRLPPSEVPAAPPAKVDETAPSAVDEDAPMADASPLPPTAPSRSSRSPSPAPLLRLPSSTRPAPPSLSTLSSLRIHAQVRSKLVVDPSRTVRIGLKSGREAEDGTGVSERGRRRLAGGEMVVEEWFAVQTATIPLLLPPSPSPPPSLYPPTPPRDLLVSAPTGSGKTLSYVVPVVEVLSKRVVTRLRALVLLPTRDLVGQVRETFEGYARGTGLKIGVATGQHSFAHEQAVLVGSNVSSDLQGGSSLVDILIATPGRLMDHLKATRGFSLQHLRFLVVDEADRLLTQSFHDWLPSVLAVLKPSSASSRPLGAEDDLEEEKEKENLPTLAEEKEAGQERLKTADAVAPAWWDAEKELGGLGRLGVEGEERMGGCCQKLLFSATLSRDPAKIAALQLHRPIFISVEDSLPSSLNPADGAVEAEDVDGEKRFTFPEKLEERMIVSPASHKPLYLFHLLHSLFVSKEDGKRQSALCFTKSVEAATRLAKLVEFFEEAYFASQGGEGEKEGEKVAVKAFSSELAPGERKKVLKEFKEGKVTMLIASDLISRGIDLPSVAHVVSYDIPSDMRKYVHRVGRTARAGQRGEAWSLVEEQEVAPFKAIMTSAQHYGKIERLRVKDREVEGFVPAYQTALEKLKVFFATGAAAKERAAA
ncbi:hypothetical protein JCM8547_001410 [Rhodosporidiobolus lusitaniae]